MEIISHGLWTAAGAHWFKRTTKKPLRLSWAVFWGLVPDFFAFTIITFWYGLQWLTGNFNFRDLPEPSAVEPSASDTIWVFRLTSLLYSFSHSLVVFALVLGILLIIKRRVVWEIFGWLFHIVIDVFTHSYSYYPTPVLWPLSGWKFDGISWETPWFMMLNYLALALVYWLFIIEEKHILKLKAVKVKYQQKYQLIKARYSFLKRRKEEESGLV